MFNHAVIKSPDFLELPFLNYSNYKLQLFQATNTCAESLIKKHMSENISSIPVKVSRKLKSEVKLDFCIKLNSWNLLSSRSESKKYIIDDTVTFSKKLKLNAIARSYVYQRLPGSINI